MDVKVERDDKCSWSIRR